MAHPSNAHHEQLIGRFIHLIEEVLIELPQHADLSSIQMEPTLIIDMRDDHFNAFVLSLDINGRLHRLPRPIRVEEAEGGITAARNRPGMHAYRKIKSQAWVACSENRARQLMNDENYEVALNLSTYITDLPEADQTRVFERLFFTFLALLTETDSGQDYQRILIIIDHNYSANLVQSTLKRIGIKLDKGSTTKWQDAMLLILDSAIDLIGYAFLATGIPFGDHTTCLLLVDPLTAYAYEFKGADIVSAQLYDLIDLSNYDQIIILLDQSVDTPIKGVQFIRDWVQLEEIGLNGYLNWWLQINEERVVALHRKREKLLDQLNSIQQHNQHLEYLLQKMSIVLDLLNRNRG
jgi:hypothetical protein